MTSSFKRKVPLAEPPGLYWTHVPDVVQDILALYGVEITAAWDLHIDDDGSPIVDAADIGQYTGHLLLHQAAHGRSINYMDLVQAVAEVTAHFARKEKKRPPALTGEVSPVLAGEEPNGKRGGAA